MDFLSKVIRDKKVVNSTLVGCQVGAIKPDWGILVILHLHTSASLTRIALMCMLTGC